jgi:hypothetical protein
MRWHRESAGRLLQLEAIQLRPRCNPGGLKPRTEGFVMAENRTVDSDRPQRMPFPFARLLYAFAFGVIGWFVIHLIFAVAVVQFAVLAVTGRLNDELKAFSLGLVQYLWEILAFVTFVRDEQPFPIGPFPRPQ